MPEKSGDRRRSPLRRRRRAAVVVAAVAAVAAVAGVSSSFLVRSPQQAAAEAEGPGATILTAVVERRTLQDTVLLRGTVTGERETKVTHVAGEGTNAIVTAVRTAAGERVRLGDVLIEVAGRPIIALAGIKPAYRDLLPGSSGDDVKQLQESLRSLGFAPGETDGYFGSGTKRALARMYERSGYEASTTSTTDEAAVDAAENAVVLANRAVEDAAEALSSAVGNSTTSARKALNRARQDAVRASEQLRELEDRSGAMLPLSEFVFVQSFPARVEKLSVEVGSIIKDPPLTLSSGKLVVHAEVNPIQRELLEVGMKVSIEDSESKKLSDGEIQTIGELSDGADGGAVNHDIVVRAKSLSVELDQADVRLRIERSTTETPVLVVPQAAVFTSADGESSVFRQSKDGTLARIAVRPGMAGDGYVAVEPSLTEQLTESDLVVVGESSLVAGE